jgi:leucyl/phenylalanyl-tRNA--protein transferase
MLEAYVGLHELGHAHSVEVWENGELAGGLYGVKLGRVFFGESMFHLRSYASKAAVVFLVEQLRAQGVELLDCQQATPHMLRLGAEEIPRQYFLQLVRRLCAE